MVEIWRLQANFIRFPSHYQDSNFHLQLPCLLLMLLMFALDLPIVSRGYGAGQGLVVGCAWAVGIVVAGGGFLYRFRSLMYVCFVLLAC